MTNGHYPTIEFVDSVYPFLKIENNSPLQRYDGEYGRGVGSAGSVTHPSINDWYRMIGIDCMEGIGFRRSGFMVV